MRPSERLAQQGLDYRNLDLSHPDLSWEPAPKRMVLAAISANKEEQWEILGDGLTAMHYALMQGEFVADEVIHAPGDDPRWGHAFFVALEDLGWH